MDTHLVVITDEVVPQSGITLSQCERREILLAEHQVLRRQVEELRRSAGRLLAGRHDATGDMLRTLATLQSLFPAHLDHEEALLEPLLEKIDAWGPMRLERLHEEHRHQRLWLSTLRSALTSGVSLEELAQRSNSLCDALTIDMAHEEADLFSVLCDDVIQIDVGQD